MHKFTLIVYTNFKVMDNVLKLQIRGFSQEIAHFLRLHCIYLIIDLLFFVLGCRYYKSLIKHAYQPPHPPPPALLIIVFVSRLLCAVR